LPHRLATTLTIEGDPQRFAALLPDGTRVLSRFDGGNERHLVYACRNVRLRVCITAVPNRPDPVFIVPVDHTGIARVATVEQFYAFRAGRSKAFARPPFSPSPYHRRQLARLLAIADAARAGAQARDIAFGVVFPNTQLSAGRDWKGSNEQRQTRRLTREAERMIDGGFWRLPCFVPE
jgi:Uncharacterized conserved protein (DUF2285)